MTETFEEIVDFISTELLETDEPVDRDENLLSEGMVDSLGMLRLVAFIEANFQVKVPPQDFTIEHFRNAGVLSDYVDRKRNAGAR